MIDATGCDGVMVGRAAIGNPFIFKQLNNYFSKGEYEVPTAEERFGMLGRFLRYSGKEQISKVRFQALQFVQGVDRAAEIRQRIARARSIKEIIEASESYGWKMTL